MPNLNAAATLEQANDFAADYGTASIVIRDGITTLATHPISSFTTTNIGATATATAVFPSGGEVTIAASGTADTVLLVGAGGKQIDVTADITLSTTTFVTGETSTINSLVFTFPV